MRYLESTLDNFEKEASELLDHVDRNKYKYLAGATAAGIGGKLLSDRMEEVKQRNRLQHAVWGATGGGLLGWGFIPKVYNMKRVAATAALAGLGTYLADDGDAWDTPFTPYIGPI